MLAQESVGASDQITRVIAETKTRLRSEFEAQVQPDVIQKVVDDTFKALQDAPVRDFVPLFVYRAARDQLTDMARAYAGQ